MHWILCFSTVVYLKSGYNDSVKPVARIVIKYLRLSLRCGIGPFSAAASSTRILPKRASRESTCHEHKKSVILQSSIGHIAFFAVLMLGSDLASQKKEGIIDIIHAFKNDA